MSASHDFLLLQLVLNNVLPHLMDSKVILNDFGGNHAEFVSNGAQIKTVHLVQLLDIFLADDLATMHRPKDHPAMTPIESVSRPELTPSRIVR